MYRNWDNPEPSETITMSIDDREEEKEMIANLKIKVQYYKEIVDDFIKMIELVQNGKRKIPCLYDWKDCIKKDLATSK